MSWFEILKINTLLKGKRGDAEKYILRSLHAIKDKNKESGVIGARGQDVILSKKDIKSMFVKKKGNDLFYRLRLIHLPTRKEATVNLTWSNEWASRLNALPHLLDKKLWKEVKDAFNKSHRNESPFGQKEWDNSDDEDDYGVEPVRRRRF